jgi:plasmid stabilization system protein ParE
MTRFTVVWTAEAISELARIWTAATERDAVTAAAARIDAELADDADKKGVPLREGLRKLACPPLAAIYCFRPDDRVADVNAIGLLRRDRFP